MQQPDWREPVKALHAHITEISSDLKNVEHVAWEANAKAEQALNAMSILGQRVDRRLTRIEDQLSALPRWGITLLVGIAGSLALLVIDLLRTR